MVVKIKKFSDRIGRDIKFPCYATEGSAGIDLSACIEDPMTISPGVRKLIPTGVGMEIPSGYAGFVFVRSSLGFKYGVTLPNSVGVIDSDYRGEIFVAITNISSKKHTVLPGERIAQIVIMPAVQAQLTESDELNDSLRGQCGFGSTGRF